MPLAPAREAFDRPEPVLPSRGAARNSRRPLRVLAAPNGDRRPGNPYLRLLYGGIRRHGAQVDSFSYRRALLQRYDVVHLHWPESLLLSRRALGSLLRHGRLAIVLARQRARGARIVWTCHNLHPHEADNAFSRWLFRTWFVRLITDMIALSPHGLELAETMYPPVRDKRRVIIPHGHYRPIFPPAPDAQVARRSLGISADARVLLSFGQIRPYKQVPELMRAFSQLDDPTLRLVVAGKPLTEPLARELSLLAARDRRIVLRLGEVPDAEVPRLFAAADLAVYSFADILNSGSVMLALSLDRPALAPRLGALPELQSQVGARWLQLYDPPFSAHQLLRALDRHVPVFAGESPDLRAFDWDTIASATYLHYTGHESMRECRKSLLAAGK